MTLIDYVPAREPVSQLLREAARLGVQPETLSCIAALPWEAIVGSLIPCLKTKERQGRRGIGPGTAIALRTGHAAARHRGADLHDRCQAVSACVSRTRALGCTAVYGFGRVPADIGRASQYDEPTPNMGKQGSLPVEGRGKLRELRGQSCGRCRSKNLRDYD